MTRKKIREITIQASMLSCLLTLAYEMGEGGSPIQEFSTWKHKKIKELEDSYTR